jgi:hypothetical protein
MFVYHIFFKSKMQNHFNNPLQIYVRLLHFGPTIDMTKFYETGWIGK